MRLPRKLLWVTAVSLVICCRPNGVWVCRRGPWNDVHTCTGAHTEAAVGPLSPARMRWCVCVFRRISTVYVCVSVVSCFVMKCRQLSVFSECAANMRQTHNRWRGEAYGCVMWRYTLCVSRRCIVLGCSGSSVGRASVPCTETVFSLQGLILTLLSHPISCHLSKLAHQIKPWKGPKNGYLNIKVSKSKRRCIV